ncbi:MAG TPA: lipoprotein-releasing ABC transporter permease subunit [Steroidobacteraceae bacterium]|nr:lipoprotein-releasing ABC transporter permease subunit [Steroidobacteraceae bacterium]
MSQPLPLFIGLRYVRSRQHKFFVSLITWVSLMGVALGVAALIVVLSVMNGFAAELRDRLLALNADARIVDPGAAPADADRPLAERLAHLPGVVGVAPYIEITALAVHQPDMVPVLLRGIDPALEARIADVRPLLVQGSLDALRPGSDALIVGENIADQLGVRRGDALTLLVATSGADGIPHMNLRRFQIAGVFEAGIEDDDNAVLATLADVRAFAPAAQGASGLRLRFDDVLRTVAYMPAVRVAAGPQYRVHDWTQDNADYFRAIRIEKTMMALILLLIVAVAAFSIVAMLVMVVNDKRTDIAILRTLGASPRTVLQTFVVQGLAIGWFGVLCGALLGVLLALNVASIVPFLERLLHFQIFSAQVYYETAIPSELHWREVGWIAAAALLLTLASTIYPALRAAATPPADALRYE